MIIEPHDQKSFAMSLLRNSKQRKLHASLILNSNNRLLSSGINGFEVPERYAFMGYRSMHSEIMSLMRLNKGAVDMNDLHLVNYRFNNSGQLRMARPCKICMPWCESVFRTITYSDDTGRMVRLMENY